MLAVLVFCALLAAAAAGNPGACLSRSYDCNQLYACCRDECNPSGWSVNVCDHQGGNRWGPQTACTCTGGGGSRISGHSSSSHSSSSHSHRGSRNPHACLARSYNCDQLYDCCQNACKPRGWSVAVCDHQSGNTWGSRTSCRCT